MTRTCKIIAMSLIALLLLSSCTYVAEDMINEVKNGDTAVTTFTDSLEPADGGLSISSSTSGEVLDYFAEIAFGSEYGDSTMKLCRWEKEISYCVTGEYLETDVELIEILVEKLNTIEGFPGIKRVESEKDADLVVMFVTREEMSELFEYADENCAGMSEYSWNSGTCEIISARAAIDCDETEERASTICEEFLQSLGLAMDSYSHQDSVFYQGKCIYKRPSELDWMIVTVLYNPSLKLGMSKYEAITAAAGILKW